MSHVLEKLENIEMPSRKILIYFPGIWKAKLPLASPIPNSPKRKWNKPSRYRYI
jgi:hypothetical protein